MADDKFVDLDEIVPDTEITDEPVKRREQPQQKPQQQTAPQEKVTPQVQKVEKVIERKEQKQEQKTEVKPVQKTVQKPAAKVAQKSFKKTSAPAVKPINKTSSKETSAKSSFSSKNKNIKKAEKEQTKQVKPAKPNRSKGKNTNWVLISLLILAVLAVGVVLYFIFYAKSTPSDSVVALVNGQPIYKSEVTFRYRLTQTTINPLITEEQVLNMTITDKLLLQEAAKKGIITSDEEVNAVLQNVMKMNNIDDATLKADLESKNLTYDYVFKLYKDTLTINKLLNSTFMNQSVTEDELQTFYDENKEFLVVPDKVQVRHILLQFSNISENLTYAAAKAIMSRIDANKSNFCDFVNQYTDDKSSASTCGEYNFSKTDSLVPEFLDAGFAMKPGDVEIVKTQFGYHIMYKVADLKGYVPTLDSIRNELEPLVSQQKAIDEYKLFVDALWNSSSIETYSDGVLVNKYNAATSIAGSNDGAQATAGQINADTTANQTTQTTVTTQVVAETSQSLLAKCLTANSAKVFVASWSPDTAAQLSLFGDAKTNLNIVECDPEIALADLPACDATLKKQYPTWPTWVINGSLVEGVQSLNALAKASGCAYSP